MKSLIFLFLQLLNAQSEVREKRGKWQDTLSNVKEKIKDVIVSDEISPEAAAALGPATFYDCKNTVHYWPREGGLTMGCHVFNWKEASSVSKNGKSGRKTFEQQVKNWQSKARIPNFQSYKLLLADATNTLTVVEIEVITVTDNRIYFNTPAVDSNWSEGVLVIKIDDYETEISSQILFHDFDDIKFWPMVMEGSKEQKKGDPAQYSLIRDLKGTDKAGREVKYLQINLNKITGHHTEYSLDMLKYFVFHSSLGFFNTKKYSQNVTISHSERVTMSENLGDENFSGPIIFSARSVEAFLNSGNANILRFEAMYESELAHYLQWKNSELRFSLGTQSKSIGVIRNPWKNKVAIGLGVFFSIFFALLVVIGYLYWKNKKQKEDNLNKLEQNRLIPQSIVVNNEKAFQEYVKQVEKTDQKLAQGLKKLYIPNHRIERTEKILGKGQFGVVSVAIVDGRECCVKTCRADLSPPDDVGKS